MRNQLATGMLVLAAILGVAGAAQSQSKPQPSAPPLASKTTGANPGTDFTGVWNAMRGDYDFSSFSKGDPPMTPWGKAQFNVAKPSQGPRGVSLKETTDAVYKCFPPGMPYIYLQLFPMQIVQTSKEVIEIFEYDHIVRHIYVDGRKHPEDLTPTYNGHSVGHWEGNTLVVDTVGLNGKLWLDRLGHPESEQMHIVERIHRVDEKTLQVEFTFDDPKAYPKPWNAVLRFGLRQDWDILEHVCEDNIAFESFEK
ncbi:MAG TPA: hypothetical protein VHS29_13325 [Candidatus Acidoferrales bacterium]|jgi:hypothetical protein|nr:hypothetical protein [Candidatus Acidoferrales bacterium]